MNHNINLSSGVLLAAGVCAGLLLSGAGRLSLPPIVVQARAQEMPQPGVRDQQIESTAANDRLPDQAHAMADVGYHFANLWFAGDKHNWPLANYYLGETRSHLKWAVRIHAVRKTSTGAEVDLNGILNAIDNSYLTEIGKAITNKDSAGFDTAYRNTLVGCYACHTACENPFLRPQIPNVSGVSILNFDPDATGP